MGALMASPVTGVILTPVLTWIAVYMVPVQMASVNAVIASPVSIVKLPLTPVLTWIAVHRVPVQGASVNAMMASSVTSVTLTYVTV